MGGIFDASAGAADARLSMAQGYKTADANEERVRARSALSLGEQRAAAAESGFQSTTGSFLTIQSESAGNAELDALTERYKGQINAYQQQQTITRSAERLNFIFDPIGGGKLLGPGTGKFSPTFNVGNYLTKG